MPLELNVMLGRSALSTARQKATRVTSTCVYTGLHLMEGAVRYVAGICGSLGFTQIHMRKQGLHLLNS